MLDYLRHGKGWWPSVGFPITLTCIYNNIVISTIIFKLARSETTKIGIRFMSEYYKLPVSQPVFIYEKIILFLSPLSAYFPELQGAFGCVCLVLGLLRVQN